MDQFWKAVAIVLLSVILGLAVGKTEKDISVLLSMAACCIVATIALAYFEPVLDLLMELNALGEIQEGMLGILLRVAGIALVAELAGTICSDAGNGSLGKTLQMLGSAAILCMSIPIFNALLTLIREILGEL